MPYRIPSNIDNVIIVGLTDKSGLKCRKKMYFVSNQGKMVENLQAGAKKVQEINAKAEYVLIVSSDIPAITGEMVDWVVKTAMQTKVDIVLQRHPARSDGETLPRFETDLDAAQGYGSLRRRS